MTFHRFDSSDATLQTVHRAAKASPNALRGISDRLNAMSMDRLKSVRGGIPQLLAPPPFKAGGGSDAAKAEFKLPIYRELGLPNRGGSRIYANF